MNYIAKNVRILNLLATKSPNPPNSSELYDFERLMSVNGHYLNV